MIKKLLEKVPVFYRGIVLVGLVYMIYIALVFFV